MKKKIKNNYKKKIYITGGRLKGRNLSSVKKIKIRPTGSRVKKTLFNWLNKNIKNAKCLDCFAGSGILSLESISRLAKYVTALEKNKILVEKLEKTIKKFSITSMSIIHTDTISWLQKKSTKYDIVYVDPPFKNISILEKTIHLLDENNWVQKNSIIYIEREKNNKNIIFPDHWKILKEKNIGMVLFSLFYI